VLQDGTCELFEKSYFPQMMNEAMLVGHRYRIHEFYLQPLAKQDVDILMDIRALAARIMNFGVLQGQKHHLELFGGSLTEQFKRNYAKMIFQINVCSQYFDEILKHYLPKEKLSRDELEMYYHYMIDKDEDIKERMFKNCYLKNHAYFLNFQIKDPLVQTDPILKVLWNLKYDDYEMKTESLDVTNITQILRNEIILRIASIAYAWSFSARNKNSTRNILRHENIDAMQEQTESLIGKST
jgi:hypothetical protein